MELPTPTPVSTTDLLALATILATVTDLLALATILATAVATATVTSGKSASIPVEFQQFAGTPPAAVYVKPAVEPPAVHVTVVGAKAMHKTLKENSNELTALFFVGTADDQAASGGATSVHPALKGLVSQFQD